MIRKPLLFVFFTCLISCGTSDGFKKAESLNQLNGQWIGGDDILKINAKEQTLQFNDGSIQKVFTEDDGYYFFINAYTGNTETFAGSVEIKGDEIKIDRIDGGVDMIYKKKLFSPKPEKNH